MENGEKKGKETEWLDKDYFGKSKADIKLANEFCQSIQFSYNAEIERTGSMMPKCRGLTEKRKGFIMARIKEYGVPTVENYIEKASLSSFLGGDNKRGWRADFEWIMRSNNFPKVLKGNYDNQTD